MDQEIRLLLIEDDADDQLFFSLALSMVEPEAKCIIAPNGSKGLEQLNNMDSLPKLIFLDLNMPIMNGFDCLKKIKAHEAFAAIPVIIFSTSNHQKDIRKAQELGAAGYLHKPNDIDTLSEKLRSAFSFDFQNGKKQYLLL